MTVRVADVLPDLHKAAGLPDRQPGLSAIVLDISALQQEADMVNALFVKRMKRGRISRATHRVGLKTLAGAMKIAEINNRSKKAPNSNSGL